MLKVPDRGDRSGVAGAVNVVDQFTQTMTGESKMGEHEHSFTCPVCSGTIGADSEAELIKMVQKHVSEDHDMQLTEEKVKDMIEEQGKAE